jgi:hypothetical protein
MGLRGGVVLLAFLLAGAPALAGALLEPHQPGWEQAFAVTWEAAEWRGRPAVRGEIHNLRGETAIGMRLLIDGLDAQGRIA